MNVNRLKHSAFGRAFRAKVWPYRNRLRLAKALQPLVRGHLGRKALDRDLYVGYDMPYFFDRFHHINAWHWKNTRHVPAVSSHSGGDSARDRYIAKEIQRARARRHADLTERRIADFDMTPYNNRATEIQMANFNWAPYNNRARQILLSRSDYRGPTFRSIVNRDEPVGRGRYSLLTRSQRKSIKRENKVPGSQSHWVPKNRRIRSIHGFGRRLPGDELIDMGLAYRIPRTDINPRHPVQDLGGNPELQGIVTVRPHVDVTNDMGSHIIPFSRSSVSGSGMYGCGSYSYKHRYGQEAYNKRIAKSVVSLQRSFRAKHPGRYATRIQKVFRGVLTRKNYRRSRGKVVKISRPVKRTFGGGGAYSSNYAGRDKSFYNFGFKYDSPGHRAGVFSAGVGRKTAYRSLPPLRRFRYDPFHIGDNSYDYAWASKHHQNLIDNKPFSHKVVEFLHNSGISDQVQRGLMRVRRVKKAGTPVATKKFRLRSQNRVEPLKLEF